MKNRGITLISLIVTIIIMIILASVTVNLITNGGIIEKTREAKKQYMYQEEKEKWELAVAASKNYITNEIDKDELEENLGEDWKVEEKENEGIITLSGFTENENMFSISLEEKDEDNENEDSEYKTVIFNDWQEISIAKREELYNNFSGYAYVLGFETELGKKGMIQFKHFSNDEYGLIIYCDFDKLTTGTDAYYIGNQSGDEKDDKWQYTNNIREYEFKIIENKEENILEYPEKIKFLEYSELEEIYGEATGGSQTLEGLGTVTFTQDMIDEFITIKSK